MASIEMVESNLPLLVIAFPIKIIYIISLYIMRSLIVVYICSLACLEFIEVWCMIWNWIPPQTIRTSRIFNKSLLANLIWNLLFSIPDFLRYMWVIEAHWWWVYHCVCIMNYSPKFIWSNIIIKPLCKFCISYSRGSICEKIINFMS